MRQLFAIFRNSLLETIRQPVYGLVLTFICGLSIITPAMAAHIYTFGAGTTLKRAPERMVADLGMTTVLLGGLILAVFTTTGVISREIENKTALTVLSKSISRTTFVFGKFLGVAMAIGMAAITGTITVMLTVRLGPAVSVSDPIDLGVLAALILSALGSVGIATVRNYFTGRPWISSYTVSFITLMLISFAFFALFDKNYNLIWMPPVPGEEPSGGAYDWQVARAAILTIEAVLILAGVAVAASTRLGAGGNFCVTAIAFVGGLVSENFLKPHIASSFLAKIGYSILPNLQVFWMSDALTREKDIPLQYLGISSIYAASYILAMLFLAALMFQRREIS